VNAASEPAELLRGLYPAGLRVLATAWIAVILVLSGLRAVVGAAVASWVLWVLLAAGVMALTRAGGAVRVWLWAGVHAGACLGWLLGRPGGLAGVSVMVVAGVASVSLAVITRSRAVAWAVALVVVLAAAASVTRVTGGAS
jgi:hypothetical protein